VAGAPGLSEIAATPATAVSPPPGRRDPPECGSYYGQKVDTSRPPFGQGYPHPLPYVACGYTPPQMRQAYGLGGLVAGGEDGAGVTVAVIDAYASSTLFSDAATYSQRNDPGHVLRASQFSEILAPSFSDAGECAAGGWLSEQTLDVEAVHAMAPGAHVVYVGAKNCFQALYDSLRTVIDRHMADVVTDSWGDDGGDLLDDAGTRASVDNTLLMAAGTGVSVLFSSGDNGDEFTTLGVAAPDFPASSPWATAVGGTTLQIGAGGSRSGESGWSTALSYLCTPLLIGFDHCTSAILDTWLPASWDGGSGGGTSYHYSQPGYQAGIVPRAIATRNAPVVGPTPMRVEPDVAMDGDPGTGLLEGETQTFPHGSAYGQYRNGGTSLSSPLFAGVVALADQVARSSLGLVNPVLYNMVRDHPSTFFDIVPGPKKAQSEVDYANGINASAGSVFSARIVDDQGAETYCDGAGNCATRRVVLSTAPGYDDMTGLGAPGPGFVRELAER